MLTRKLICFKLEGDYEPVEWSSFLGVNTVVLDYLKSRGGDEDKLWTRVEVVDGPIFEVCYNGPEQPRFWRELKWQNDAMILVRAWAS